MISVRLMNKTIKILCTKNEIIDINKLKRLCRTSFKFIEQNKYFPIIVEVEKNVKLKNDAKKMLERIDARDNNTLVIIVG